VSCLQYFFKISVKERNNLQLVASSVPAIPRSTRPKHAQMFKIIATHMQDFDLTRRKTDRPHRRGRYCCIKRNSKAGDNNQ